MSEAPDVEPAAPRAHAPVTRDLGRELGREQGGGKESWVFQAVSPFTKEGLVHGPPLEYKGCSAVSESAVDDEESPPGPPPEVPRRASRGDKTALAASGTPGAATPSVGTNGLGTPTMRTPATSTPGSSASSVKMSAMEEESLRDRTRTALLRQCADILTADENVPRFTREAFRRVFQEKVSPALTLLSTVQRSATGFT